MIRTLKLQLLPLNFLLNVQQPPSQGKASTSTLLTALYPMKVSFVLRFYFVFTYQFVMKLTKWLETAYQLVVGDYNNTMHNTVIFLARQISLKENEIQQLKETVSDLTNLRRDLINDLKKRQPSMYFIFFFQVQLKIWNALRNSWTIYHIECRLPPSVLINSLTSKTIFSPTYYYLEISSSHR